MLFEEDFWGSTDMFGRLAPSTADRGKFFLFYSYTGISGQHADFAVTTLAVTGRDPDFAMTTSASQVSMHTRAAGRRHLGSACKMFCVMP